MSKTRANGESWSGKQARGSPVPYRRFFWILAAGWTITVAGSLAWNLLQNARELRLLSFKTAQALLDKDLLYREWSILHGGVYIPKEKDYSPVAGPGESNEEIQTPGGKRLVRLNPAVVSREIFAQENEKQGIKGHITSLKPIVATNQPDAWERQALEAFAHGSNEVSGLETVAGRREFRLMRPLVTIPECLDCHEETGHKPGALRGGISVSVPLDRFTAKGEGLNLAAAHGGLWFMGLAGLLLGLRSLEQHDRQRMLAEERTEAALKEKEALLQEIHHRVKNNLQVISSLLQLQINELKDPATAQVFRESQLRVRSMALIHETLYQSDSLARIDTVEYFRRLTSLLFSTYADARGRVRLESRIAPAGLTSNAAIPLGLIANELITNSLKFAFPADRHGVIRVELAKTGDGAFRFQVADDGVGLPGGLAPENTTSLGMRLVKILTGQLGARGAWEKASPGTSFVLDFRDEETPGKSKRESLQGEETPSAPEMQNVI